MPSTIPYTHPSLVLGNIVNPDILGKMQQISTTQGRIDAAQNKMNALIAMKTNLEMTVSELLNMGVDVSQITQKIGDIDKAISTAATDYITVRLDGETSIQAIREAIDTSAVDPALHSPLDFARSTLIKLPLSADSLHLDARYFSWAENQETNPLGVVAEIEDYLKAATAGLGTKNAADVSSKAVTQINLQRRNYQLSGTLIITASCTHKQARVFSPCVLDPGRAVGIWNSSHPQDTIDPDNPSAAATSSTSPSAPSSPGPTLTLLSGASYGSCFIGMVHILRNDATGNNDALDALADSLQQRFRIGNWVQEASGGFGVDPTIATDIKSLLSTQTITTHINLVTLGALPSIRSNQLQMGVRSFRDPSPQKLTSSLAAVESPTPSAFGSIQKAADTAKAGARVMALQDSTIQSVMLGLGNIDQGSNKVLDINTLLTAFEDYIQEVRSGEAGIPVSFFLTTYSRDQLVALLRPKEAASK